LFFSFLIWNFLCFLKNISSLVSRFFFPTIFSFLKLVCGFWQIARLQEFFLLLLFHHLLLLGWGTWMDGWRDGWMERTTTTGQTQGYYIRRLSASSTGRARYVRLQALSKNYFSINSAKYGYISHGHIHKIPGKVSPIYPAGAWPQKMKWHLPNTRLILL